VVWKKHRIGFRYEFLSDNNGYFWWQCCWFSVGPLYIFCHFTVQKKGARLPIFTFFAVYKAPALIALFFPMLLSIIWLTRRLPVPSIAPPLHLFWLTLFGVIWFGFYRLSHGSLVGQFVIGLFLHICHNARPFIKNPSLPYGFGSLFMLAPHFIVVYASKNHLFLHNTDDNV